MLREGLTKKVLLALLLIILINISGISVGLLNLTKGLSETIVEMPFENISVWAEEKDEKPFTNTISVNQFLYKAPYYLLRMEHFIAELSSQVLFHTIKQIMVTNEELKKQQGSESIQEETKEVETFKTTEGTETIKEIEPLQVVSAEEIKPNNSQRVYREELTENKTIRLTFDDGPNGKTSQILNLLKKYDMKGTFFFLSEKMKKQPDLVKRVLEEGHTIGVHGVTHDAKKVYANDTSVLDEMNIANDTLESITGQRTELVRVPYGSKPLMAQQQVDALYNAGYIMWDWNVDSKDSSKKYVPKATIVNTTISYIKSKTTPTILFHDKKCTVDALPEVLDYIKNKGYATEPLTPDIKPLNWWKKY